MTAFRMTLWLCGLLFIATIYNVTSAYNAMGSVDVQSRFEEIGLLENGKGLPYPPRKPLQSSEFAAK